MPIRSHVDMSLFAVFLYIEGEKISSESIDLLVNAPDPKKSLDEFRAKTNDAWKFQSAKSRNLIFHETYHYWQALTYPFLQSYGLYALRSVSQLFTTLSKMGDDFHEWGTWGPVSPNLKYLSIQKKIWFSKDAIVLTELTGEMPYDDIEIIETSTFSILDLLENATSIAEWQVTAPSSEIAISGQAFSRWKKRTPAYTNVLSFVARVLQSDELALRCFIPLVTVSFETSDPLRAFTLLLTALYSNLTSHYLDIFISQKEPCRWLDLFRHYLDEFAGFEQEPDSFLGIQVPRQPFFKLTSKFMGGEFVKGDYHILHPIIGTHTNKWKEKAKTNLQYTWLVSQPAWVSIDTFQECSNYFQPSLMVVRFNIDSRNSKTILLGNYDALSLQNWSLKDIMAMYSVTRRAGNIHFDPDHRFCHHKNCPEYLENYCNSYPVIPINFQDCDFTQRVNGIVTSLRD